MEHERQISLNTQKIADLLARFPDINDIIKDTNTKITDHIFEENKTWIEIRAQLKQLSTPTVRLRTVGGIIVALVGIMGTLVYVLHVLHVILASLFGIK